MIQIVRTDTLNKDFITLVGQLDAELARRDGDDHAFYDQFNKIENMKHAIVLYENQKPLGCGAVKEFNPGTMEIKRMYVAPESRGKGFAAKILASLEEWARELQFNRCVLETGKRQPEAIRLYRHTGYRRIPNDGQSADVENSLCFEKKL
jgi:GNAT superfamily N-acetyltransferase